MLFNVIDIPKDELDSLSVAQMKLLRAAQRKKDEIVLKAREEREKFRLKVLTDGMKYSSLLYDMTEIIDKEMNRKCAILADDLIYAMSVCVKNDKDESGNGGGSYETGYLVDYSLSYSERYVIVRDYYLQFTDVNERMAKYSADEVAKKYLGSYYGTLYNILATYEK